MFNINITDKNYVDKRRLLVRLGYIEGRQKLTKSFNELIKIVIELAGMLIKPRQIVNISNIKKLTESEITFENGFTIKSGNVAALFEGCRKAFSFIVTIGPKLEQKRDHFIATKEPTQAMLLDACGSVAAESLAEELSASIAKDFLKKGFSATKRYSPGYGDWHISAQKEFMDFLNAPRIGVNLSETFLMSPEKTISAVVGFKPLK